MKIAADVAVVLIAAIHVYILVLEMFFWKSHSAAGLLACAPSSRRRRRPWPRIRASTTVSWRPACSGG